MTRVLLTLLFWGAAAAAPAQSYVTVAGEQGLGSGQGFNVALGDNLAATKFGVFALDGLVNGPVTTALLSIGYRDHPAERWYWGWDLGLGSYNGAATDQNCWAGAGLLGLNLSSNTAGTLGLSIALRVSLFLTDSPRLTSAVLVQLGGDCRTGTTAATAAPAPREAPGREAASYRPPLAEPRVSSIQEAAEWVHANIEYDWAKARNDDYILLSPAQVLASRGGVCRDMVVLTMKIVYDSLGAKARFVGIRVPGSPGHAILEFNGRYFDPTSLRVYTEATIDKQTVMSYDETMAAIARQVR